MWHFIDKCIALLFDSWISVVQSSVYGNYFDFWKLHKWTLLDSVYKMLFMCFSMQCQIHIDKIFWVVLFYLFALYISVCDCLTTILLRYKLFALVCFEPFSSNFINSLHIFSMEFKLLLLLLLTVVHFPVTSFFGCKKPKYTYYYFIEWCCCSIELNMI